MQLMALVKAGQLTVEQAISGSSVTTSAAMVSQSRERDGAGFLHQPFRLFYWKGEGGSEGRGKQG